MQSNQTGAKRAILSITGMTCRGCVDTVTRVLERVPGVTRTEVDLARARAVVEGAARSEHLVAAAEAAGFGATVVLEVSG